MLTTSSPFDIEASNFDRWLSERKSTSTSDGPLESMWVAKPAFGTAEMSTTSPFPYSMVMVPPTIVYDARCMAAAAVVEVVDVLEVVVAAVVPVVDVVLVAVDDVVDVPVVEVVLEVDGVTSSGSVVDELVESLVDVVDVSSGTTTTSAAGSGSRTGTPADNG